mgnify:FL=1|jgi:methionine-gamma-lyase
MDKINKLAKFNPEQAMFEGSRKVFGEFGGVNSCIHPSSTFTTMDPEIMSQMFSGDLSDQGCYLYGRHFHPNALNLGMQIAAMENTEIAYPVASGMAAITTLIRQVIKGGGEIVASSNVYGGTYAYLRNLAPLEGGRVTFVNSNDTQDILDAVSFMTNLVVFEMHSNPSLNVINLKELKEKLPAHVKIMVDNTFTPLMYTPANLGADYVVHSGTKFINGMSDGTSGFICCSHEMLQELMDLNSGQLMLSGPVLDARSCWQVQQYMQTLPIRMREHSLRAHEISEALESTEKFKIIYPGLETHPGHEDAKLQAHADFRYGGILAIDLETYENARKYVKLMQDSKWGLNAVSLGYYHTLMSISGSSTSSEIEPDVQEASQLSPGLVRVSVGFVGDVDQQVDAFYENLLKI